MSGLWRRHRLAASLAAAIGCAAALTPALVPALARAATPPTATAADDTPPLSAGQMDLAMQVVQAFGIQQVADAAMEGLRIVLVQSLAAHNNQPPDKVAGIVDAVLVPDLRAMEPQFVAVVATDYAHAFTIDELQQILAFYQTPAGVKLETLLPTLTQQMVAAGHAWIDRAAAQVLRADAGKLSAQGLSAQ